ncbi:MAG: RHS repeat-associated core domain-containing protein [Phycisphaerae bacterium]
MFGLAQVRRFSAAGHEACAAPRLGRAVRIAAVTLVLALHAAARGDTFGPAAGGSIPDNTPAGLSSTITVSLPNDPLVSCFNSVTLTTLIHGHVGDLRVRISHNGANADLFCRIGANAPADPGDSSNVAGDYTFADSGPDFRSAAAAAGDLDVIAGGAYARSTANAGVTGFVDNDPLSVFAGLPVNGDWTLTISDHVAGEAGSLGSWSFDAIASQPTSYGPGTGGAIIDNFPPGVTSTISVNDPGGPTVGAVVAVTLVGASHPFVGDLRVTVSHAGVSVDLFSRLGAPTPATGDSSDLGGDYRFTETGASFLAAAQAAGPAAVIPPGSYARSSADPSLATFYNPNAFAAFAGVALNGDWTLTVSDNTGGNAGSFSAWTFDVLFGCTRYNCVAGMCQTAPGGTYASQSACAASCSQTGYACIGAGCAQVPGGPFPDFQSCMAACQMPTGYACTPTGCQSQPGGPFSTLQACMQACGGGGGLCPPGACDDHNPCTTDSCDPQTGACSHQPMNCDDGNPCTVDVCVNGVCQHTPQDCNDNDPCTDDACVNGTCQHTPHNCDDGDPCTVDSCVGGQCQHVPSSQPECQPPPQEPVCDRDCPNCGCGPTADGSDVSDPIHLFSGEFYRLEIDLQIVGRGIDFTWARTYRSRSDTSTALGHGWDFAYNLGVQADGADVTFLSGTGRADRFNLQADGTWTRPEYFRTLAPLSGMALRMTLAECTLYDFLPLDGSAAAGRIAAIEDRNHNRMTFEYDAAGRLWKIRDPLNQSPADDRVVTIGYDVAGHIVSLTDWTGRQVTYSYYGAADAGGSPGDLKSVTTPAVTGTPNGNDFPLGKTTTYTYSRGLADERLNHNLLTVTDPRGQTYLTNSYAPTQSAGDPLFDRVVAQVFGTGRYDYVYTFGLNPAANNGAVSKTTVNNRAGDVKELYFDARNRLVRTRVYTGRAADPAAPTDLDLGINPPVNRLRADDPAYFQSDYEWNDDSQIVREISPAGSVIESQYDDGNPDPRARGNRMMMRTTPGPAGGDQTEIVELFEYETSIGGCPGANLVTRRVDGRGSETLHGYDAAGNCIHTQYAVPGVAEDFEYNSAGQLTAHVHAANGAGHRRRDTFAYYASGPGAGLMQAEVIDVDGAALTTQYEYDARGNRARVVDPRGNDSLFDFNALNQVVRARSRAVSPGGPRYETLTWYDAADNVVRIDRANLDETGAPRANAVLTTIYEYDILDKLVRTCQERGDVNVAPNVLTCAGVPSAQFVTTEYAYDANENRVLTRHGAATSGAQPANVVQTLCDERDLLYRVIRAPADAAQSTTQYDYDANGNLRAARAGLEDAPRVTHYAYDGYNRLVSIVDAMGNVASRHYDAAGNIVASRFDGELLDGTGGGGNVRLSELTLTYDALNRRTRIDRAFFDPQTQSSQGDGQSTTTVAYAANSQVTAITDDGGHALQFGYDTANRRTQTTDPRGNVVVHVFDGNSNVAQTTWIDRSDLLGPDESFRVTYAYDGLDRRISATDSAGNVRQSAFDSRNDLALAVDALGRQARYEYDGLDRLTRVIRDLNGNGASAGDPADIVNSLSWDDSSRRTARVDAAGHVTAYAYDPLDRVVLEDFADCTQRTTTWDVHDNRRSQHDANDTVLSDSFDGLDRLVHRDIARGPGVRGPAAEDYQYDGLSRLVRALDDDSDVTRAFDSLGQLVRETQNGRVIDATFTADGLRTRLVYPGGRTIDMDHDALHRVRQVRDGATTLAAFSFVGPSRRERRDFANGTRTEWSYDGRLGQPNAPGDHGFARPVGVRHTRIAGGTVLDDRAFAWDAAQNRKSRRDLRDDGQGRNADFTYDAADRLIRGVLSDAALAPLVDRSYDLDGANNRRAVSGGPDAGAYLLDPAACEPNDAAMNQYSGTPFDGRTSDANGNLASAGDCLTGDANGDGALTVADAPALVQALLGRTTPACGADVNRDGRLDGADVQGFIDRLTGVVDATWRNAFAYDYRNHMVEFADTVAGRRHVYAYDALGRRIARTTDVDTAPSETRYFYDGQQVIEEQNAAGATQATYVLGQSVDELLSLRRFGQDYYVHADDQQSVVAISDAGGRVVERADYDDYGTPHVATAEQAPARTVFYDSDAEAGPVGVPTTLADDFVLPSAVRITGVRWWGGYLYAPGAPASDDFTIRIHADSSGQPGAVLLQAHVGGAIRRTASGQQPSTPDGVVPEYAFEASLPGAFAAVASTRYWVSISDNTTGHPATFAWEASAAGNQQLYFTYPGGGWVGFSGDVAFALLTDRSAIGNPYLFTGREYDPETGWYNFRTRYLDPRAGRFTTRDVIGLWGDAGNLGNAYAYVGNNPATYSDPFGLEGPRPRLPGEAPPRPPGPSPDGGTAPGLPRDDPPPAQRPAAAPAPAAPAPAAPAPAAAEKPHDTHVIYESVNMADRNQIPMQIRDAIVDLPGGTRYISDADAEAAAERVSDSLASIGRKMPANRHIEFRVCYSACNPRFMRAVSRLTGRDVRACSGLSVASGRPASGENLTFHPDGTITNEGGAPVAERNITPGAAPDGKPPVQPGAGERTSNTSSLEIAIRQMDRDYQGGGDMVIHGHGAPGFTATGK